MEQLTALREELKICDEKILEELIKRNDIVEKIMVYKEAHQMQIFQPDQEEKQHDWLTEKLKEGRHSEEIIDIFNTIQKNSKRIQAHKLFDYNIVLIGFMGVGKTTIAEYLSALFDMEIVEMDSLIAEREEMSISDIFEVHGEEYFRNKETELLVEMQKYHNVIISCGGGTPLRDCNVAEMKKNGRVVLLTADPHIILERVKNSYDRPLINNNKNVAFIENMMEERRTKYETAADVIIHTDHKTKLEICEELVQSLLNLKRSKI